MIVRAARSLWHWRWLLVMNLFLLSPVLLYEFRIGEGGPDRTILFIFSASILSMLAAQMLARRVWIVHALMFPLYLVVATDLYVILHYHTRLSSSMLLTRGSIEDEQRTARERSIVSVFREAGFQTYWIST